MNNIYFSIILLSHNNPSMELVLQAVKRQTCVNDEIIIVDDHSDDEYINNLNRYISDNNIILLHSNRIGNRSYNRNIGARHASKDVLLFLDGDIILMHNSLSILRRAHMQSVEKAFIGPKHNIHYDQLHFELYSGIDNYLELLQTPEGQAQLSQSYFFVDERESFFDDTANRKFFWMHYYTGASSVERETFFQCGEFDESFVTWGSEDVDLGYRIQQICEIGFLKDFHAFHIPHPRDSFKIETSNIENILKMLKKYKSWEFEMLYSFNGNPTINKAAFYMVNQMRTLSLKNIENIPENGSSVMIINTISNKFPNGYIKVKQDNLWKIESLIGIAIPYASALFDIVCISENIFTYPAIITSRILQEAVRVGKYVYIQKMDDKIRINWNDISAHFLPISNYRISYHSDDIMDYYFNAKTDDHIEVLSALPDNVMRSPIFWGSK